MHNEEVDSDITVLREPSWDISQAIPGGRLAIRALKADGSCYRWWTATVEYADHEQLVSVNRVGDLVEGTERGWTHRHHVRNIFWRGRPYNLAEVFELNGTLKQLYVHIASMPSLRETTLAYIDHELDVIWRPGQPIRVADENEFIEAAAMYGYTEEFQTVCRLAVNEARGLVAGWQPGQVPGRAERKKRSGIRRSSRVRAHRDSGR